MDKIGFRQWKWARGSLSQQQEGAHTTENKNGSNFSNSYSSPLFSFRSIMMLLAVYLGGLFHHSSRATEHYKLLSRFSSYLFMCLIRQYLTTTRERYILSLCCCCCVSENMDVRKSRAQAVDKSEGINTSIFHFSYILILALQSHLSSEKMFLRMYVSRFSPLSECFYQKQKRKTRWIREKTSNVYTKVPIYCWYKQPGNVSNFNLFSFFSHVLFIYDLLRFGRNINRILKPKYKYIWGFERFEIRWYTNLRVLVLLMVEKCWLLKFFIQNPKQNETNMKIISHGTWQHL